MFDVSLRQSLLSVAVIAALFATGLSATDAVAQSRFGLQLEAGAVVPIGASMRNVVVLAPSAGTVATDEGRPLLVDRRNHMGLHVAASALISTFEVRYQLERLGWRDTRARCVGDRIARRLPNGEVDDQEVRYDCASSPRAATEEVEDVGGLMLHHLNVGMRIYLRRRAAMLDDGSRERTRLFLVGAPGFSLARFEDPTAGRRLRAGLNLGLGGGAEIPIDHRLSVTAGLRYTVSMIGASSSPGARARRAIPSGRGVVGALFDDQHRVGADVGIRYDFR